MKWLSILWQLTRDVGLTGFGAWIIWKQVYAPQPDPTLLLVALGCMSPAAKSAVAAILSGPGLSSESPQRHSEPPPPSSPKDGGDGGEH